MKWIGYALLINVVLLNGIGETSPAYAKESIQTGSPTVKDPTLKIEKVFDGLKFPTAMAFLDTNDILVLEKNNGTVQRVINGKILPKPLLDVNVDNKSERGMLGMAIDKNSKEHRTNVFLYFTESASSRDGDDICPSPLEDCVPGHDPAGNRLYRYELVQGKLVNPKLLLNLPAIPGPVHNGGKVIIGPDDNLYVSIGDLRTHMTKAENFQNGSLPDATAGILRINQNGTPPGEGIISNNSLANLYYAYGIRNSFGMDFDPVTKDLWDTENGPNFGDEINLIKPGFNSGWRQVQGIWKPNGELEGNVNPHPEKDLVNFNNTGRYDPPQFTWKFALGVTGIKFLNSDALGQHYKNDMFVGTFHSGTIYRFGLNATRTGLLFSILDDSLNDRIANKTYELKEIVFAQGFGGITDIEVNPYDGYLYILALHQDEAGCDASSPSKPCVSYDSQTKGTIFRIVPATLDAYH
jgi:aldose sugar dehydrogenase